MKVDDLSIQITTSADEAAKSLDNLIGKIQIISKELTSFGNSVKGLSSLTAVSKGVNNSLKDVSFSAADMQKRVSAAIDFISSKYSNLGKDFKFFGDQTAINKQIEKISNALETAKLKQEELGASGKIDGQMFEYAVRDAIKYNNQLEALKKQLASVNSVADDIKIHRAFDDSEVTLEGLTQQLKDFVSIINSGGLQTEIGTTFPVSGLEISLQQLQENFPQAIDLIHSYETALERAESLSRSFTFQSFDNIDLSKFENISESLGVDLDAANRLKASLLQLTVPDITEGNLDKLYQELNKNEQKLEELRIKLQNGLTMGKITQSIDDSGFTNLLEKITLAERQSEALRHRIVEVQRATVGFDASSVDSLNSSMAKVASTTSASGSGMSRFATIAKSLSSKLFNLAKSLTSTSKSGKSLNLTFANGFKTFLKYALGLKGLTAVFNKLRSGIVDGFKNLAQYDYSVNESISLLKNSFNQLKNSLAASLAPALNALAPIIDYIAQLAIRAANALNQLFSVLSGSSTWTRATKLTDNYADSLRGAAKAAQSATMGIDELNIIAQDNGGGAGETSPADMFETLPIESSFYDLTDNLKDMWNNADFSDLGYLFGKKIQDALNSIDFESIRNTFAKIGTSLATLINGFIDVPGLGYDIGRTIGNAINIGVTGVNAFMDKTNWKKVGIFIGDSLNGMIDIIDWVGIGHLFAQNLNSIFDIAGGVAETVDWSNWGLSIATSLDTFISDFKWEENGVNFGNLINGLIDSFKSFIVNTDWVVLGKDLATNINASMRTIDWFEIAETFSLGVDAILDTAIGFMEELDWGELADTLWDLLQGVDWIGIVGRLGTLLLETFRATFSFGNQLSEDLTTSLAEFFEAIGWDSVAGFLNGIAEMIENTQEQFEYYFGMVIEWVKELFGIHSPSTVFSDIGMNIIEGLYSGISNTINKVLDFFTKTKDSILATWETVKTKTSEIWQGIGQTIKDTVNSIIGFVNGMIGGISTGINSLINAMNNLSFDIPDWVPELGGKTFGFSIPNIELPQIPYLAGGGVATRFTPAIVGEAGYEAILPLENRQTMQMIADSILENASMHNNGYSGDITDSIRSAIHEEVNGIVSAFLPYISHIPIIEEYTKETADKDLVIGDREVVRAYDRGRKSMGASIIT